MLELLILPAYAVQTRTRRGIGGKGGRRIWRGSSDGV